MSETDEVPASAPSPAGPEDYGATSETAAPDLAPGGWRGNGADEPFTLGAERPMLPVNYEAEQALLGALLDDNEAYDKVGDILRPEHFADPVHGRIFEVIAARIQGGHQANATTISDLFEHDPDLAPNGGGGKYLTALQHSYISVVNVPDYGQMIQDLWLRRELIGLGEELAAEAGRADYHEYASDLVDQVAQRVFDLAENGDGAQSIGTLGVHARAVLQELEAAIERGGGVTGLSSGFRDLDELLGGFQPGDLIVLAGRPSMGKSACGTAIAMNVAETTGPDDRVQPTVIFSLEMTVRDQTRRIIAERSRMSAHAIRKGAVGPDDLVRLHTTVGGFENTPLHLDGTAALSVRQIHTRARRIKRQHGLALVVVDHLGFIRPVDRRANKVHQIEEICHDLRTMAKDLDVPVIVLHQLSRTVEGRDDKRPMLADLRDSGNVEQDADVVIFIYRDEYYLARRKPRPGADHAKYKERHAKWEARMNKARNKAELIVAKQRNGPVDTVDLFFDTRTLRWENLVEEGTGYG